MKWLSLCLLLFLSALSGVAQSANQVKMLNMDSLTQHGRIRLDRDWKFSVADFPAMCDSAYNDKNWILVNSRLTRSSALRASVEHFNGIGWFRKAIYIDTSLVAVPLALTIEHLGASEIYIDSKKIQTNGVIGNRRTSEYINPKLIPFIAVFKSPGRHVFAVRYANFDAQKNYDRYDEDFAGFALELSKANQTIESILNTAVIVTFVLTLLFGIFLALAVAHIFMFLYNRSSISNLYFAVFCASIGFLCFIPWKTLIGFDPGNVLNAYYTLPLCIAGACFSLSGFANELFARQKKRFFVIAVLCVAAFITFFISRSVGGLFFVFLSVIVMLEAIVLVFSALFRRVKGARIIGGGVLMFTLFSLFIFLYAAVAQGLSFEAGSGLGIFFLVMASAAILSLPVSMSLFLAWNFASVNKALQLNLVQVRDLSAKTLEQEQEKKKIIEDQNVRLEREVAVRTAEVIAQKEEIELQHDQLKTEKEKSDNLLLNILPAEIAGELKETGHSAARAFNNVTVIFTDFVDFTKAGERMTPQELVDELHVCFMNFDKIIEKHKVEKIKTIGDAYLAVCGLPAADPNHAVNAVNAALEIREFMMHRRLQHGLRTFDIRIGMHSGSVVAGIVGTKKFAYDIWGDTVNTAARMEQSGAPGRINISESVYMLVKDRFDCTFRGMIEAKNKGELRMYFVNAANN
jgi:adenylate cyclase